MKTTKNSVKINKSMVMKAAWLLITKKQVASFAEALRKAWKAYRLKAQMALGVVKFSFVKANGEIRKAVGTLAKGLYQYENKGTGYASPASCIRYFDLERKAFRSFTVSSLI